MSDPVRDAEEHLEWARHYLPRLYSSDVTLTHLKLSATNCRDVSVIALADALRGNKSLLVLQLEDNGITDEGLQKIAEVVKGNDTLLELQLDGNDFTDEGVLALAKAAEDNFSLTKLTLTRNHVPLSEAALNAISTIIRLNQRPPALKRLVLQIDRGVKPTEIDLTYRGEPIASPEERAVRLLDDFCAEVLADAIGQCPNLARLALANNVIGDAGAAALARAIAYHQLLHEVDLSGNLITDVGADAFTEALQTNNSVQRLNVLRCLAGANAVIRLELALLVNAQPPRLKMFLPRIAVNDETLTHLELDDHQSQRFYDDASVRILLTEIQERLNTNLISLAMPNGRLGEPAALCFARYLKGVPLSPAFRGDLPVPRLQVLDLSHNPGLGAHSQLIAEALLDNKVLVSLNLSTCNVTDGAASSFAALLEENTTLTHLDLSHNQLIRDAGAHFAYAFNVNHTVADFSLEGTSVSLKVLKAIDEHRQAVGEPEELQLILPQLFDCVETVSRVELNGIRDIRGGRPLKESSARLLAQPLANNFVVTYLDVSDNSINFDGAAALLGALHSNRVTLKHLNMSNNPIGHSSSFGRLLGSVIAAHTALRELRVESVGLTTEGIMPIISELDVARRNSVQALAFGGSDHIASNVANYAKLLVACNQHDNCFKLRMRALLRRWFDDNKRGIDMTKCEMNGFAVADGGELLSSDAVNAMMPLLCDFLELVPTIERVELMRNNLSDSGVAPIAEWLAHAPHCSVLLLDSNNIGAAGISHLALAVRSNYVVHKVSVAGNRDDVPEDILMELTSMLHYNEQPQDVKNLLVSIGNDAITAIDESHRVTGHLEDMHVRLIAKEMFTNTTLTSINLSNNYITTEGFRLLLLVMEQHPHLKELILRNTLIQGNEELGNDVAQLLYRSKTIQSLDLSYNDFTNSFIPPILKALETNGSVRLIGLTEAGVASHLEQAVLTRVALNSEQHLKTARRAHSQQRSQLYGFFDSQQRIPA
jgi:Ran GTPase-activating protein (RanGAP) involved in mRNA processing and transport